MKKILPLLAGILLLSGCNSYGPYSASVYQSDNAAYIININTWVGSKRGWPHINRELQTQIEHSVLGMLKRTGISVKTCLLINYTPFEGGHMSITLIAGNEVNITMRTAKKILNTSAPMLFKTVDQF